MHVRLALAARLAIGAAAVALTVGTAAHAQTKPAASKGPDPAKAQQIATQNCAACHGADGNSSIATNPSLAGQGYDYLLRQLRGFKIPAGKDGARPNPIMTAQVANLSDDDLKNLAAFYAGQKPKENTAKDKELVQLGAKIYRGGIPERGVAACAGCHSPNGAGVPAQFPRLAGQHAEYTEAQMKLWRSGERSNDPNQMMRMVAARMSDREIRAVSDYIAGLR